MKCNSDKPKIIADAASQLGSFKACYFTMSIFARVEFNCLHMQ